MTPFEMFVQTATDLYRTNPDYRAEIEGERDPEPSPTVQRPPSTWERLNDLEWLIRNGMSIWFACEQVGWEIETARVAAIRWQHPVHARLLPEIVTAPSEQWAMDWLAGKAA